MFLTVEPSGFELAGPLEAGVGAKDVAQCQKAKPGKRHTVQSALNRAEGGVLDMVGVVDKVGVGSKAGIGARQRRPIPAPATFPNTVELMRWSLRG